VLMPSLRRARCLPLRPQRAPDVRGHVGIVGSLESLKGCGDLLRGRVLVVLIVGADERADCGELAGDDSDWFVVAMD
jgi:hypothetical protein